MKQHKFLSAFSGKKWAFHMVISKISEFFFSIFRNLVFEVGWRYSLCLVSCHCSAEFKHQESLMSKFLFTGEGKGDVWCKPIAKMLHRLRCQIEVTSDQTQVQRTLFPDQN